MKKSLFCLLLASFMALSACGGMGDLQSSISSDDSSILDSSSLDNSSILDDSPILDSSLLGDSSTPDDSSVVGSSTPNEVVKGEKVVDEDAWVAAFENVRDNYTATGLQFFDNYLTYATFKFDGKKFELNEKPIENGEYIGDFTHWTTEVNGVSYVCAAEGDKCEPWETHSKSWEELTGIYDIAYTIWSRYSLSDYTYLEESGSYYLNKIDSGFDIHLWVTIENEKVKYMKYETQYDGQNMGLEYVFGETEIELPAGLPESQN